MGKNKAKTGYRQTESNLYDSTEVTYHVVPLDIIRQHGGRVRPADIHISVTDEITTGHRDSGTEAD